MLLFLVCYPHDCLSLNYVLHEELVTKDEAYKIAKQSHLSLLEKGLDFGTEGSIGWSRDGVHER
jgi:hypothetical protein